MKKAKKISKIKMRAGVWPLFDGGACLPAVSRQVVSFFGVIAKK